MIYCETPGALIDVAYFLVFYYNEEFVFNKLYVQFNETVNHSLEYYYQMKYYMEGLPGELPPQLHPFLYVDDTMASILPKVIYDHPFQKLTLNELLTYLNSDDFKVSVYQHWFGDYCSFEIQSVEDINKIDVRSILTSMRVTEQMKYRILLCFDDFDASRKKLIKLIKKVHSYVIILRKNNEKLIINQQKKFDDINCYKKILTTSNCEINDYYYTIALINAQHLYINKTLTFVTFGIKSYNYLINSKEINVESFASAYSDKTRVKIVKLIAQYQQLSINEIVQHLAIKQPTIYHHINMLWEEGIIVISKQESKRSYYQLNLNYFEKISKMFNNTLKEYQSSYKKENEG